MMDYLASLGIIVCALIAPIVAQEFVTVGESVVVKPTPNPLTDASQRVDVQLNCTGSRSELSYYIKNQVLWYYINSDGSKLQLTDGFYTASEAKDLFFGTDARYLLAYRRDVKGYRFDVKITGVTHADNGIFRCVLRDENSKVIDYKDVSITVVNPVQEVAIELHDMKHNVLAQSVVPLSKNTTTLAIPPGEYMIQCDTYGSNPAPIMSIWYNDNTLNSTAVAVRTTVNNRVSYNTSVSIMSQTIVPHSVAQIIMCSANIPGEFYPTMQSGISLMVQNNKPEVTCSNITTMVGNKYATVECTVTTDEVSKASLTCSKISWLLGDENIFIEYDQRWADPNKKFDILESACENGSGGLDVSLTIYSVKSSHLNEVFYVVYNSDAGVYRYPVPDFSIGKFNSAPTTSVASVAILLSVSIISVIKMFF